MAGNSLEDIRNKVYELVKKYVIGDLDWRNDIGSKEKLAEMAKYSIKVIRKVISIVKNRYHLLFMITYWAIDTK